MSTRFTWNKREVAATTLICLAAAGFSVSWVMLYTEPVEADTAEKVELSQPAPDAVPPVDATESVVQHFDDGSWLDPATGEQGCDLTGSCASVPLPPAGTPTTPDGGYFPNVTLIACPQEDSDNCYWDAARFGNHEGTSFIRLDGITYYPEAVK